MASFGDLLKSWAESFPLTAPVFEGGRAAYNKATGADAAKEQRSALDQAMQRLEQYAAQSRQQRMSDLQRALGYYKPAETALQQIYGPRPQPAPRPQIPVRSAPGGWLWGGGG